MSTDEQPHGEAEGDCMICFEDLEASNYFEYRVKEGAPWLPGKVCTGCLGSMIETQFESFMKRLAAASCEAERRRMLAKGPPAKVTDRFMLPVEEGEEVYDLWYASDKAIHSAELKGAPQGEARKKLWDELNAFKIEGADPDEEEAEAEKAKTEGEGEAAAEDAPAST